jgi:DNA-binding response OmpR family regulator
MPRDRKRAEEAGLFRYLTKPVDVDALLGVLEEVLRRERGASSPDATG